MRFHFRTRLLVGFVGLAVLATGLLFLMSTQRSKAAILEQIQTTVLTIALDAASRVDAAVHETIKSEADAEGNAYSEIQLTLREVRDRNRRSDIDVRFIYTHRKVSDSLDKWAYVVDAEEAGEDQSSIGEIIEWNEQGSPDDEPLRLGAAYVDNKFVTDIYGTWLSGYAPIRDVGGEIIAMVGVDLSAAAITAKWDQITNRSLVALVIALAVATLLATIISRVVTKPLEDIDQAVLKIGAGHLETRVPTGWKDEFGRVAENINTMAEALQERDALKGALSRYVSQDAARRLIEEKMLPELRGERRNVTVLIGDIANLSCVAEKLPPEQLVTLLNEYFEKMVDIIFHHNGTIDRLLGNRLIAVFGAPISDDKKERNAINAAIAMRAEQSALNKKWNLVGDQKFRLGVGIHSGSALLGNIGSRGNVEFTVLGSSVDIASLIGSKADDFKTDTLVSESTVAAVRDEFGFDEVGDVQARGVSDFIRLYTVRKLSPI